MRGRMVASHLFLVSHCTPLRGVQAELLPSIHEPSKSPSSPTTQPSNHQLYPKVPCRSLGSSPQGIGGASTRASDLFRLCLAELDSGPRRHFRVRECPFLALSGHQAVARQCPLSGAKRTLRLTDEMSAYDPKRIFDRLWGGGRPKPDVLLQGHVVRSLSA
jgi:hypothetical protein